MCIVHGLKERFLLIIAAVEHHGAFGQQLAIKFITVFKSRWRHPSRRPHTASSRLWKRHIKRPIFAAQKASRGERLQFLPFPKVETLADVDKCREGGIQWPRSGPSPTQMWRGHCLGGSVACMPLELMP